jgi:hypothetical protein
MARTVLAVPSRSPKVVRDGGEHDPRRLEQDAVLDMQLTKIVEETAPPGDDDLGGDIEDGDRRIGFE